MNPSPAELLDPIFNFLDALIQNYGVYLYLVFVWLAHVEQLSPEDAAEFEASLKSGSTSKP